MKKVFEMHCHCHLFDISIGEKAEIFKEEFAVTGAEKACFLSIPQEYDDKGGKFFDGLQNIKVAFLKRYFSPNGYAYAGLVHPEDYSDEEAVAEDFLRQVTEYYDAGFDGIKMLEGYPTFIKYTRQGLDSPIYDKFYAFCEKKGFPITAHIANPDENWDIKKASKYAIEQGRVYDETYPRKEDITRQTFSVLQRFPELKLAVAHFGFFSEHYDDAERFMSYKNTYIDITPGDEQLRNMLGEWDKWHAFWLKYQDRIFYGTDFYAFPKDENQRTCFTRRPWFLREFLETNTEHKYLDNSFKGVKIEESVLDKIYMQNALKLLGNPKKTNNDYFVAEAKRLSSQNLSDLEKKDLKYILDYVLKT